MDFSKPFIVFSSKVSTAKNGTKYQTLSVKNTQESGTVNVWGVKPLFGFGATVIFTGVKESQGFYSTDAGNVKFVQSSELTALLPSVPTHSQWLDLCSKLCTMLDSPTEIQFVQHLFTVLYEPYSKWPAARGHHHAYPGGLLEHTYELLNMFTGLYSVLPFKVSPFVVIVACALHDEGKLSEYTKGGEYTPHFFLQGHPFISAEYAGMLLRKFNFSPMTVAHIQSAILSHHGRLEYGSPVLPCNPESFIVAKLDELSGVGVQYDQPSGTSACGTTIQRLI